MINGYVRRMRREMRGQGLTYHDDTLPTRTQNVVLCVVTVAVVVAAVVLQLVVGFPGTGAGSAPHGVTPATAGPVAGHRPASIRHPPPRSVCHLAG